MPHNFYLHSSIVQSRKFGRSPIQIKQVNLSFIKLIKKILFKYYYDKGLSL